MTAPLKIFICYKKILLQERDGRTVERINDHARRLNFYLSEAHERYDPWIDDEKLGAGVAWETKIYRRILESDVLIVLIGPGTSQSPWVQREVALANAFGIAVVPIGAGLSRHDMDRELKDLGIERLQGKITQNLELERNAGKALRAEFGVDLEVAATNTRKQKNEVLRELLVQPNQPDAPASDNQKAATFKFNHNGQAINLHVASGDISKVRGIDVLVNSENDYMQMARTFESRTISSMLRRLGASTRDGRYKDTIQNELDWQVQDRSRPLQPGEVFVTSSGGPASALAKVNGARYILHVAAVQSVAAESRVVPFKQPHQIESCVRGSLEKLCEINRVKGVISPKGSEQYDDQRKRAAQGRGNVKSIIFPLFGTGQGGTATADVLNPIFAGIHGFFEEPASEELSTVLSDIYISAFKQKDVDELTGFLRRRFGRTPERIERPSKPAAGRSKARAKSRPSDGNGRR